MIVEFTSSCLIGRSLTIGNRKRLWTVQQITLVNKDGGSLPEDQVFCIFASTTKSRFCHEKLLRSFLFRGDNFDGYIRENGQLYICIDRAKKILIYLGPPEEILCLTC